MPSLEIPPQGWFAVINVHGHISDLFRYRAFAESSMKGRGDRETCRIALVDVTVREVFTSAPSSAPKRSRKA
jgi:hypothetical protein